MIHIQNQALPPATATKLAEYQQEIDAITDYAEQIVEAKQKFSSRNRKNNPVFKDVRVTLSDMCSGSRRCMYCEDSCADEVEHIKPKDLYPELVFVWKNYLYACGSCNGGKNNAYKIFDATGKITDITRKQGEAVIKPIAGNDVFINPRFENPLEYLWLDLSGTFAFIAHPSSSAQDKQRARYTIDTLELNRDILLEARKEAYGNYRARLKEYIFERDNGTSQNKLKSLIASLIHLNHPTVWYEMKRQKQLMPELKTLFEQAPEALNW